MAPPTRARRDHHASGQPRRPGCPRASSASGTHQIWLLNVTTTRASAAVPVGGSTQPATGSQPDGERDGLEDWLQDLRTDLTNDPPDWLDTSAAQDLPLAGGDPDWLDPRPVEQDAAQAGGAPGWLDPSAAQDAAQAPGWVDPSAAQDAAQAGAQQAADGGSQHAGDPEPTYGNGHLPPQTTGGGRHRAAG